jgi:hypothetical protein
VRRSPKPLTLAEQAQSLRASDFKVSINRGSLRGVGLLRPGLLFAVYRVEVQYSDHGVPEVFVLEPGLVALHGPIPHTYAPKPPRHPRRSLCLYTGKWHPCDRISDTIVPWTAEWLAYYEVWLATGEWLGGGGQPSSRLPRSAAFQARRRLMEGS